MNLKSSNLIGQLQLGTVEVNNTFVTIVTLKQYPFLHQLSNEL